MSKHDYEKFLRLEMKETDDVVKNAKPNTLLTVKFNTIGFSNTYRIEKCVLDFLLNQNSAYKQYQEMMDE